MHCFASGGPGTGQEIRIKKHGTRCLRNVLYIIWVLSKHPMMVEKSNNDEMNGFFVLVSCDSFDFPAISTNGSGVCHMSLSLARNFWSGFHLT